MKEATMSSRKKSARVIFMFLAVMALFAMALPEAHAEVTEEWVARYDGPANGYDGARAIATDKWGNVYVTGRSYGNGTYDDYATVAYDSLGNRLWAARYDGPANYYDRAHAIATDSAGNVYVTGQSWGSGTSWDYATVAYNPSGKQLWVARYDGPAHSYDYAFAIAIDDAGNVYVTGRSYGSGTGDDYATVAYDSSGNRLWVARYDGPTHGWDWAAAIATDSAGNVYVTGRSPGIRTGYGYATVAYDSSGNQLWVARYNGPANFYDRATAIATDSAGNVYVTGYSWGSGTRSDYATVAYDSSGSQLWVARYDGPANYYDYAYAIAIDKAGNVYVTGESYGGTSSDYATVAYDSMGNQLWLARYNGPGNGRDMAYAIDTDNAGNVYVTGGSYGNGTYFDYATIAYDPSGNQLWLARYDGPANYYDYGRAIAVDNAGNVYVTGETSGSGTYYDYTTIKYPRPGPSDPIDLIDYFLEQGLIDPRMETSLKKQAENGAYGAFLNHVEAQSGKKIDPDAAAILIDAARQMAANN